MTRIVLAYSGGPDTSAAIPWLAETYAADIITVTIDLGQGRDLEEVRDRALANGAAAPRTSSTSATSLPAIASSAR